MPEAGITCTRAAPCSHFGVAHDATNAEGVISVLDPIDENLAIVVTKSLTIRAEGVDAEFTLAATNGFFIIVTAGATDVVTLKGLH